MGLIKEYYESHKHVKSCQTQIAGAEGYCNIQINVEMTSTVEQILGMSEVPNRMEFIELTARHLESFKGKNNKFVY